VAFILDIAFTKKYNRTVYILTYGKKHHGSRRKIRMPGHKLVMFSRFLWNLTYPDNQLQEGEVIHHKDFDRLNDDINNLAKLTHLEHELLHRFHEKFNPIPLSWCMFTEHTERRSVCLK
jgi:hypothetical protein